MPNPMGRRGKHKPPVNIDPLDARDRYEDGASLAELAAHYDCSDTHVTKVLRDAGTTLRSSHSHNRRPSEPKSRLSDEEVTRLRRLVLPTEHNAQVASTAGRKDVR